MIIPFPDSFLLIRFIAIVSASADEDFKSLKRTAERRFQPPKHSIFQRRVWTTFGFERELLDRFQQLNWIEGIVKEPLGTFVPSFSPNTISFEITSNLQRRLEGIRQHKIASKIFLYLTIYPEMIHDDTWKELEDLPWQIETSYPVDFGNEECSVDKKFVHLHMKNKVIHLQCSNNQSEEMVEMTHSGIYFVIKVPIDQISLDSERNFMVQYFHGFHFRRQVLILEGTTKGNYVISPQRNDTSILYGMSSEEFRFYICLFHLFVLSSFDPDYSRKILPAKYYRRAISAKDLVRRYPLESLPQKVIPA